MSRVFARPAGLRVVDRPGGKGGRTWSVLAGGAERCRWGNGGGLLSGEVPGSLR